VVTEVAELWREKSPATENVKDDVAPPADAGNVCRASEDRLVSIRRRVRKCGICGVIMHFGGYC